MPLSKIILLIINILGGASVIGSYIFGLKSAQGGINALWGGTPEGIKPIYTVSMLIAALGYLCFLFFIFFKLDTNSLNFNIFYLVFFLILGASSFWLPLTNMFLQSQSSLLWFLIRLVLAIVGVSSCALVWILIGVKPIDPSIAYRLAIIGSSYFAFHTAILDMILWPIFFKLP